MPPASNAGPSSATSRLYLRILVAAVTGGLAYLIGSLAEQSVSDALMLSVFVTGVVLVVQLLAQFDQRVATVQDLISERFSAVSDATRLFGQVDASKLRAEVRLLAESSLQVNPATPALVVELARSQVERTSHFLRQISGEEAVYDGEDRDWLLALTHLVKGTIDATSHGRIGPDGRFEDEGLWRTELGQRYLEAQKRALRSGVVIRRVFILERAELAEDAAFRTIYREQLDMGIQVRAVDLTKLRGAGTAFVADFILFDDEVSYEPVARFRQGLGPMFVKTSLVLDHHRIGQQRQRFEELWAAPNELDNAEA